MEATTKHFRKRNAILECLRSTTAHPSAETVHEMLRQDHPDISLATVYRNLALFKKQGLIQSIGTVNGTERFDANVCTHVHFVCSCCDAVLDLPLMDTQESLCTAAAEQVGGQVTGCSLIFTGKCSHCV